MVYQVDSSQVCPSMPLYGSSSGENGKYREMLISVWMVDGVSWCRPSLSPGDRFYILAVPGLRSTTAIIFICCAELSAVPVWTLDHLANILGSS